MPRAKLKESPLVSQGYKVFISYDNPRAYGTKTRTTVSGWSYTTSRHPTEEFMKWMADTAGPRDILWTVRKNEGGVMIYFYKAEHAMLAKLTWGGQ